MLNQLQMLKGKEVEVDFRTTRYTGLLLDASEDEVFLQVGESWIALPMNEICDIRPLVKG
jgi:hypothetical protein